MKRSKPNHLSSTTWAIESSSVPSVTFRRRANLIVLLGLAFVLVGCARFKPAPPDYQPYLQRLETQTNGPVTASVAIMSRQETKRKFDLPLHKKSIQPVFVRLENQGTNDLIFLPAALDPNYFSAGEAAYMHRKFLSGKRNRRVEAMFRTNEVRVLLPPGGQLEGFVYANYDPGAKHVRLDVLGKGVWHGFEFTLPVPGRRFDYQRVDFENLYPTNRIRDYRIEELPAVLAKLPVATTDAKGKGTGDPINLVVVSEEQNPLPFLRAGWDLTETLSAGNAFRLIGAFLFNSRWRTSPVSSLFLFGRRQDFALQKARHTIHERNHLRLWLASYTCEGRQVWVGQISRDIGLRFSFKAPGFVTHKIDPEVDEARDYLAQDLMLSGGVERVAWVRGVGTADRDQPRRNLTGDPYYTDGSRVILFTSRTKVPLEQVELLDWATSAAQAPRPE